MSTQKPGWKIFGRRSRDATREIPNLATEREVRLWLIQRIASQLELELEKVDPTAQFSEFGLTSMEAVSISGELEQALRVKLPATLLWDYETIERLADHIGKEYLASPDKSSHVTTASVASLDVDNQKSVQERVAHLSEEELDAILSGDALPAISPNPTKTKG